MGLEIKKTWIEAEDLKDRIQRLKTLYPFPNRYQQRNIEDAMLKLNDLQFKLEWVGKSTPITFIEIQQEDRPTASIIRPIYVIYTTHDDFELEAMFKRDYPHKQVAKVFKVFTAKPFEI